MLKILVMGAGAIGCFVGGSLAAAGHQVTLVGRPPLMQKIASSGLTLKWPDQPAQTVWPQTVTAIDQVDESYDFILLTVKTPDTVEAIRELVKLRLTEQASYVVSLQNGLGNEETLAAAFGPERVIAGTITIPIQVPELGMITVSKAKGGLGLAPLVTGQPVERLAQALEQAGLEAALYHNYRAMKWSKLLLNIINNASSAILNEPPAQIIAQNRLLDLEIAALGEGVQVMEALGLKAVNLPGYRVAWLAWLVSSSWLPLALKRAILRPLMQGGRGDKMPSLQIDLAAGRRRTEVEALNGAIVQAGRQLGVATPVNQTLTAILKGIVNGQTPWGEFQHQPQKLVQAAQRSAARWPSP